MVGVCALVGVALNVMTAIAVPSPGSEAMLQWEPSGRMPTVSRWPHPVIATSKEHLRAQ
jgi:hypothetical protein